VIVTIAYMQTSAEGPLVPGGILVAALLGLKTEPTSIPAEIKATQ
jgi:hypothetical protein